MLHHNVFLFTFIFKSAFECGYMDVTICAVCVHLLHGWGTYMMCIRDFQAPVPSFSFTDKSFTTYTWTVNKSLIQHVLGTLGLCSDPLCTRDSQCKMYAQKIKVEKFSKAMRITTAKKNRHCSFHTMKVNEDWGCQSLTWRLLLCSKEESHSYL